MLNVSIASKVSSSHIFNHKGGLQLPGNNNAQQQYTPNSVHNNNGNMNAYGIAMSGPRDSYIQQSNVDNYRAAQYGNDGSVFQPWPQQTMPQFPMNPIIPMQQQPQAQLMQQQQQNRQMLLSNAVSAADSQQQPSQQQQGAWPVRPLLPVLPNTEEESNLVSLSARTQTHDQPKKGQNLNTDGQKQSGKHDDDESQSNETKESDYDDEEKPTEAPKKKSRKRKKLEKKEKAIKMKESKDTNSPESPALAVAKDDHIPADVQKLKIIHSDLELEFLDHDGASDRPGGAVLSLTLGKNHFV